MLHLHHLTEECGPWLLGVSKARQSCPGARCPRSLRLAPRDTATCCAGARGADQAEDLRTRKKEAGPLLPLLPKKASVPSSWILQSVAWARRRRRCFGRLHRLSAFCRSAPARRYCGSLFLSAAGPWFLGSGPAGSWRRAAWAARPTQGWRPEVKIVFAKRVADVPLLSRYDWRGQRYGITEAEMMPAGHKM